MSISAYRVGQQVELNDKRIGTICYLGTTNFSQGEWVGVALEKAEGKNDGSVQGTRYFECPPGHGIFLRATGIGSVIEETRPRAKQAGNGVGGPAANGRRQTLLNGDRRASAIGSGTPTPASRLSVTGIRSPVKSPTKQLAANGGSSGSTTRTNTPPARSGAAATVKSRTSGAPSLSIAGRRTSTLPSAVSDGRSKSGRQSLVPPASRTSGSRPAPGSAAAGRAPARSQPVSQQRLSSTTEESAGDGDSEQSGALSQREASITSEHSGTTGEAEEDEEEPAQQTPRTNFAPPPVPPIPPDPVEQPTRPRRPSSPTAASIHSQRTIRSTAASTKRVTELEKELEILKRRQTEDRELKQRLDKAQQESDQYKKIIEKLQNKYRPQQQEMEKLKKELEDYQQKIVSVEELQADYEHAMESALLDREVAEETAEGLKAELDILRANNEEMTLELDILREENSELSKDMSPEERTSASRMQLEKQNDRYREALMRYRDFAEDKEAELKEQIRELEEQIKEAEPIQTQLNETKEQLLRTEADKDDLRQQLEAADAAEDMVETLTEENHNMRDKMLELRGVIEDLEDLREVNDEIELTHIEAEKQMQEEIDFKDSLLLDRERTAKEQQAALDEADYNINRFRALVGQLQSDLQDLEASKQISETEASELSSKSKAMLDLNMKLQSSAAKTQVKALDLELRRLDAQQASEHLEIVQLFLPETFDPERDSVLALLRFKRIAFKANLVQSFVQERIASFGTRGTDEDVFAACETYEKLTWVSTMADRFVKSASGSSIAEFGNFGSSLLEVNVVERTLDDYTDSLRREDAKESEMNTRLGRCIEVMSHLAEHHRLSETAADRADELLMKTSCLQGRLQGAIYALTVTRTMVETNLRASEDDEGIEDENASDAALVLQRLKSIIEHLRSAKVVSGKTHRALGDLQARSLTLEDSLMEHFTNADVMTSEIGMYTYQTGADLQKLFGEEGRAEPFSPADVAAILSRLAVSIFALPNPEPGPLAALNTRLRNLRDVLADISALPSDLDNTVEFDRAPSPWLARANELKQRKIASVDTEAELSRMLETVRERDSLLKTKETELEEQSVRIEMLEARMRDAGKRSARIGELEQQVHDARESERRSKADFAKARAASQQDLERVREEMTRLSDERRAKGEKIPELDGDTMGAQARSTLRRQEGRIQGLEGAVRHLKEENHHLRFPAPDAPRAAAASLDWLHVPLLPASKQRQQAAALQRRGEKINEEILSLAARPPIVDLTTLPANKLAWRPAKEGSRWKVERCNEEWAGLKQWRREIIREAEGKAVR